MTCSIRTLAVCVALALAVAPLGGCGADRASTGVEDNSSEAQGLRNLGKMYRIVSDALGHPPKTINELRQAEAQVPGGFSEIGDTNVAIFFNVPMAAAGASDETVLAYDRMAPHQGGYVLLVDGSVKRLTAAEFKAAKKAGTKPWMSAPGS